MHCCYSIQYIKNSIFTLNHLFINLFNSKKTIFIINLFLLIFSSISISMIYSYQYLTEMNLTEDYPNFMKFAGSIHGYFLAFNYAEISAPEDLLQEVLF